MIEQNAASPSAWYAQGDAAFLIMKSKEECFVLGRPGSDLLSQGLSHSTIGAEEFNGRVRDGIGYRPPAKTTSPAKDEFEASARASEQTRSIYFSIAPLFPRGNDGHWK